MQAFIPGYEVEVPVVIDKQRFAIAPMGVYYRDLKPLGTSILDYEGRKAHTYHFADFHQVSAATAEQLELHHGHRYKPGDSQKHIHLSGV